MDAQTTLPTCYRHGDRETRLACSRCERPICSECVRPAPVGQLCPDDARPAPGARVITSRQLGRGPLRETAPVTFGLIVACVAIFLLARVSPGIQALGWQENALIADGQWWRIVTAAFLHGGLLHLLFNMYALYLFGPTIERQVGGLAFLGLYLGSAMAGGAAYYLAYALEVGGVGPAVGASGAIFGLFGATLVAAWRGRRTPAGNAFVRQLVTLLAINLALPLFLPGIAWQAHVGGLVGGLIVAALWAAGRRSATAALRIGAGAVVGIASLSVVLLT